MRQFSKLLCLFALVLVAISAEAQAPSFSCYITNETQISPTVYQFDIYLLRTGGIPFQYASGQWGITVNPDVANGGTMTASILPGSTMLTNIAQSNATVQLPANSLQFNVAAKAPPGDGNGSLISEVYNGCSSPGTKVASFRITNSVPFASNAKMNHAFNFSMAAGKTATKVHAYVNGKNTDITANGTFYAYNSSGSCDQNIALNSSMTSVSNATATDMFVNVFPNPATTETTVSFNSKVASPYHLTMLDALGQEIMVKEGTATTGTNKLDLNLTGLAKGIYNLNLKLNDKVTVIRTVIQ